MNNIIKKNNRDWINLIDNNKLELFPIQFANCDRLLYNNAVYIFDEVGSGKTISSGLMAMDYLYNNPSKKVLIITVNALVKTSIYCKYGQFLNDWYTKMPFLNLEMHRRIDIINNHYSNIKKYCNNEYGLIIIDEAHLFLNIETDRYNAITSLRADKVVFLTATPIKSNNNDLNIYVDIAEDILGASIDRKWIQEINTYDKLDKEIICSIFDEKYPVTRYFKDTIMSINYQGYKKNKARRLLPELWYYKSYKSKDETLLENINKVTFQSPESRFVIFTRFVHSEAYKIQEYLLKNGFVSYGNNVVDNITKTIKVITGENSFELDNYKGHTNLPKVLILTYQIAEQGVNLPGYNYVINYHISAFPSSLEQRFGRIDRMGKNGSAFNEIHMAFLISENAWDINTLNFHSAVSIYIRDLISYLPSKNTILSTEIIKKFKQEKYLIRDYSENIKSLIKDNSIMQNIIHYISDEKDKNAKNELECNNQLLTFIEDYSIHLRGDDTEITKNLIDDINYALYELTSGFNKISDSDIDKCIKILNNISDNIFYGDKSDESSIKSVDAIEGCGSYINSSQLFINYYMFFKQHIKFNLYLQTKIIEINKFFENCFINNKFEKIFPYLRYDKVFKEIAENIGFDSEFIDVFCEKSDKIVTVLPFFKMCNSFRDIIQNYTLTDDGICRIRFDFNPFKSAIIYLGNEILRSPDKYGLSEEFIDKYWPDINYKFQNKFHSCFIDSIDIKTTNYGNEKYYNIRRDSYGIVQASNWYKLAYHYLRKQECYIDVNHGWSVKFYYNNEFHYIEEKIKQISIKFEQCNFNEESFIQWLNKEKIDLYNILSRYNYPKKYRSLFYNYLFTGNDNLRMYIKNYYNMICFYNKYEIYKNDIWTYGILNELRASKVDIPWFDIIKLPNFLKDYRII